MMGRQTKLKSLNFTPNSRSNMKLKLLSSLLVLFSSTILSSSVGAEELQTEGRNKLKVFIL